MLIAQAADALCLYSGTCSSRYYGKVSQDGFGIRSRTLDSETGDPVEVLTFAPVLARAPEFGDAVAERVIRLARVRHALYARTRRVDRSSEHALRLVADHVAGWRLDHVLTVMERERWTLDIGAVITLLRQLIPAVALFSRHQREATIGTIGPERLILTPQGRLVVAEYVLAPGLEKLQFPRERLWREFRVALPHDASAGRIPPSADVVGIGVVAISLLLGRRLRDDEYLVALGDLAESLTETSAGSTRPLSDTFRAWLARALQFEPEESYQSPHEAQVAFEEMLARERSYLATSNQLDRFIATFEQTAGAPSMPGRNDDHPAAEDEPAMVATLTAIAQAPPSARKSSGVRLAAAVATPPVPVAAPAPVAGPPPGTLDAFALDDGGAPDGADPEAPSGADEPDAVHLPEARGIRRFALPALAALAIIQAGAIVWLATADRPSTSGELSIQSRPVAARVTIDGEERGVTPLQAEVSAGSHVVEVRVGRSEPRVIPVMVRAGVQTGLYIELQSVATVGGLEVRSEPGKARVTVAGQYRGETPLVLGDLPPGEVEVIIHGGTREVRQKVRIEPGITSQLVVPLSR